MNLRIFPILLLLCFLLPACGGKQENVDETADSLVADTDTLYPDTIETDSIIVAAPPKKADELFDDFVYAFMHNKKFQYSRVNFPLRNVVDGVNEPISARAWKHDPLYSERDLYMTISTSRKGMRVSKDTSINHVDVQEINPTTKQVKLYDFNRVNSEWRLTGITHTNVDEMKSRSGFVSFYCRFCTDKDYQKSHVAEVVNVNTFDENEGRLVQGIITAEQWPDFTPELPTDEVMCVRYGDHMEKSDLRIVSLASPSGDGGVVMTFRLKNSEWVLTDYEN